MPKSSKKKLVPTVPTDGENDMDRQEAEQGLALLKEALTSFRSPPPPPPPPLSAPSAPRADFSLTADAAPTAEAPQAVVPAAPVGEIIIPPSARTILRNTLAGKGLPEEPREPTTSSANAVFLIGNAPTVNLAFIFTKYVRHVDMNDGRHVYKSDDGSRALWHAHPAEVDGFAGTGGSWYLGDSSAVGQRTGYARVTENTDVPEEITAAWMLYIEGAWVEAPTLKVITQAEHEAIVVAALVGSSEEVWFSGVTADGKDTSAFGVLKRAERGDARYTYRSEDGGPFALWWTAGAWLIGDASDIGTKSGFLMAEDVAYLPEKITSVWRVAGDGWTDAPDVKIVTP